MSDEQIDIFAPESRHVEPARERVVLDRGGEFIETRRADDRRARQPFKATLQREQRERTAAMVVGTVSHRKGMKGYSLGATSKAAQLRSLCLYIHSARQTVNIAIASV